MRYFFNTKDVHVDVPYICMKSNKKNSSPIVFNKILCKTIKINLKNSPKMDFFFFEVGIWYA